MTSETVNQPATVAGSGSSETTGRAAAKKAAAKSAAKAAAKSADAGVTNPAATIATAGRRLLQAL